MNAPAPIGHNSPPTDPLDDALAPYGDAIAEAENWLDGTTVENADQMAAVDKLIAEIKAARKAVDAARDAETKPLHAAWQKAIARFKPTEADLDRIKNGLVAAVDAYKRKLFAEKEAARRAAERAAWEATQAAEIAARAAAPTDLAAQRDAAAKVAEADAAQAAARGAADDKVKGLRTVTRYEITSHRDLLHWIAKHDRDAVTAFIEEWARANHKAKPEAEGLRVWTEKAAF